MKLESDTAFWRHVWLSGGLLGSLLGFILGCFFVAQGVRQNSLKTLIFDGSTALFMVFSSSDGSKMHEKPVRKQLPAATWLQERLGGRLDSILEHLGLHLGSQNRPKSVPESKLEFQAIFEPF